MTRRPIQPGSKEHRRASCDRKRRYPDQISALVAAVHQMDAHAGLKLDTYKCRFCHGWHLFRTPKKNRDIFRSHQGGRA